jgi:hypothetical protein
MRIGHTHADVYDRESDYWQDIEDAENAQMKSKKILSKAATDDKNKRKTMDIGSLSQEGE